MDGNLIAVIVLDSRAAFHADINYKRIQLFKITNHLRVHIDQVGREVFAISQVHGCVRMRFIVRAVVGIERVINRVFRQFSVQFARVAVFILSVVVVNAVGDVAGLLDFRNEAIHHPHSRHSVGAHP